jgi:uncharacterized protein (TIGR02145 family)
MRHLLVMLLVVATVACWGQTVTDYDGNVYNTVTIGGQTWMKENLKVTHFSDGIPIPTTLSPAATDSTSLFQWAYNDDTANISTYGRLYTWFAVVNWQNVCPLGWHVPDTADWMTLTNFLGGDSIAGGKMKEVGLAHWITSDTAVDNSSLFTGLPGGFRGNPSGYNQLGALANFWSSTPFGISSFQRGVCYNLHANHLYFAQSVAVANCGLSVRCIKDNTFGINDVRSNSEILLYPNPANDRISLVSAQPLLSICIYNVTGNLVHKIDSMGEKAITVNTGELRNGIYLLYIVTSNGAITAKSITIAR